MMRKKRSAFLTPGFWKRASAAYGIRGLPRAAARYAVNQLHLNRAKPEHLDLTERTDDPIEAMYLGGESGGEATPVVRIPFSSLRQERLGIRIDDLVSNPFTRTVVEYLSGECTTYGESTLRRFYQAWQPANLGEFVGVHVADDRLAQPLQVGVLPWEQGAGSTELAARREAHERSWRLKFGPAPNGSHGYSHFGPTSEALGEYRFEKHCLVAASIAELAAAPGITGDTWWAPDRGGYVEVQLLVDKAQWAALIREGKHRTVALAALGIEQLLVSIPQNYPVVHREDVASWPGVRSGLYRIEEALQVFDRFLAGAPPSGFPDPGSPGPGADEDSVNRPGSNGGSGDAIRAHRRRQTSPR